MPSHSRISLLIIALLAGVFVIWGAVRAAPALATSPGSVEASTVPTPTALPNQTDTSSPDISMIDSPTPACSLPRLHTGVCIMTWYYMFVNAAPDYIITMTVSIDNQPRARYSGFFQTSMIVPSGMMRFSVPCGALGSGGDPNYGASHIFTLRARDTSGLTASNYGTVYCPADERLSIFMPILRR
jgi:hypothetical protein